MVLGRLPFVLLVIVACATAAFAAGGGRGLLHNNDHHDHTFDGKCKLGHHWYKTGTWRYFNHKWYKCCSGKWFFGSTFKLPDWHSKCPKKDFEPKKCKDWDGKWYKHGEWGSCGHPWCETEVCQCCDGKFVNCGHFWDVDYNNKSCPDWNNGNWSG